MPPAAGSNLFHAAIRANKYDSFSCRPAYDANRRQTPWPVLEPGNSRLRNGKEQFILLARGQRIVQPLPFQLFDGLPDCRRHWNLVGLNNKTDPAFPGKVMKFTGESVGDIYHCRGPEIADDPTGFG